VNRYPFAPLAALMGVNESQACKQLRVSGSTAQKYRRDGMTAIVADGMAVRAGFHPQDVWSSWMDDQFEAVSAPCADCGDRFIPVRRDQRCCSKACKQRLWVRERRRNDPIFRERANAYRRRYYQAYGDYERAQHRTYDRARAAARAAERQAVAA
jgi:hypothetical protein